MREPGSAVPVAAAVKSNVSAADGTADLAAGHVAVAFQQHRSRPGPEQPAAHRVSMEFENEAVLDDSGRGLQQTGRQAMLHRRLSTVAPGLPLVALSMIPWQPDSSQRTAKRQRLSAIPVERRHSLAAGSPHGHELRNPSPVSGELPPRWKAPKRPSMCQPAVSSTALPDGVRSPAAEASLQRRRGSPEKAAPVCGRAVCNTLEEQVVPATPAGSSPSGSTVRAKARTASNPGLRTGTNSVSIATGSSRRALQLLQTGVVRGSDTVQQHLPIATCTTSLPSRLPADSQPEVTAGHVEAMQPHGGWNRAPAISLAVSGRDAPRMASWGSRGSDADLARRSASSNEADPLRVAGMTHVASPIIASWAVSAAPDSDPLQHAVLPLLSCPIPESLPAADRSSVPCSQSLAQSPCSEPQQPSAGNFRCHPSSEPLDPDRAVVPETLVWQAGCSQWAAADGTGSQQPAQDECAQICSAGAAAELAAVQLPATCGHAAPCSNEPVLGFTAQLGEPTRCILSSSDGR